MTSPLSGKVGQLMLYNSCSDCRYGLPDMRHPRAGLGLAALQGKLYAAGGWRDRQYSRAVERFDPLTDRWTDLPGLQERRGKLGLARQQQSHRWPGDAEFSSAFY